MNTLFSLTTTRLFYTGEQVRKLEPLGFRFVPPPGGEIFNNPDEARWLIDESRPSPTIQINSLGELETFSKKFGTVIISFGNGEDTPNRLQIFDGSL